MSTDTLFARIARGELPCARVLETDHALAFLDIHPVNLGHVLLIPKAPYRTVADLPDELSAHLGSLLPRLCRAVQKATGAPSFNVIANCGTSAGQTVHHIHWHIIPRFEDDAVRWPWPHAAYGDDLGMNAMQDRIVQSLAEPS